MGSDAGLVIRQRIFSGGTPRVFELRKANVGSFRLCEFLHDLRKTSR